MLIESVKDNGKLKVAKRKVGPFRVREDHVATTTTLLLCGVVIQMRYRKIRL
jgi:hypothetical protein